MATEHSPPQGPTADASSSGGQGSSSRKMRKVALASFMGTVIEFYDFGIYGTAAALVFAKAFFPALGGYAGTIVSFATLGIAFVARPLGAIVFGHYGDRLGRKRTLIATMSMMGVATVLIGLLPTAVTIGVLAPALLVLLRVAQGLAAGGEWAGAALFTTEHAPKASRGFWGMFTDLGGAVANILALVTFLITGLFMTDATFAAWGWRIPFLLSIVLIVIGLYIRLKIEETPVFTTEARQHLTVSLPFKEAFAAQWKEILLGAGSLVMAFSLGYLGIVSLTNYGTATLGLARSDVLAAGIVGNVINGLAMISAGLLSDRFGRRRVLLIANVVGIPWSLALFPLLDTKSLAAFWLGVAVTFLIAGHGFGVAGAYLSELFQAQYRYTAAGLAYSFGGVLGGAIPPLVAAAVIGAYGGLAFGVLLAIYCFVGLLCTLALRETRGRDLLPEIPPQARLA